MNNDLIQRVDAVLQDAAQHRYSVSRIYAAYNEALSKNDQPQTCASCLRNRVRELRVWRDDIDKIEQEKFKEDNSKILKDNNPKITDLGLDKGKVGGDETVTTIKTIIGDLQIKGGLGKTVLEGKKIADALMADTFMIIEGERFTVVDDETEQPATVIFTPANEGANHGIATDIKGKPAPAYVYEQNGKAYLVSGDLGAYTEVTGEPIAEVKDFDIMDVTDKEGQPHKIKFVFEEGEKGKATLIDGKALKAGTYTTKEGDTVAVQPGGKATLKVQDLL